MAAPVQNNPARIRVEKLDPRDPSFHTGDVGPNSEQLAIAAKGRAGR